MGQSQFNNPVFDDTPTGTTTITVTPDVANGTYTISNLRDSSTFSAVKPESSDRMMTFTPQYSLRLLNNLSNETKTTAPDVQFQYLSYGGWTLGNGSDSLYRVNFFLFGNPTTAVDMPKTGTANYKLSVTGEIAISLFPVLIGDGTLTANFAQGTIGTRLNLYASYGYAFAPSGSSMATAAASLGRFDGTANISSDSSMFQGQFTSPNTSLTGTFHGAFYGPEAAEVGYAFALKGSIEPQRPGAEQRYVGVAVGKKD